VTHGAFGWTELGSDVDTSMDMRRLIAEFVGTALLVLFAVGVATESFGFDLTGASATPGVVATALAFGLVLLGLVYALGPISGCHVNPAVTLGFLASGRMTLGEAIGYWIAQFAGGIAGALLLFGIFETTATYRRSVNGLGADAYGSHSILGIDAGGAFLTEVVLTALFVFVVLAATSRLGSPGFAGIAIGLALTVVHLIGIPLTGTSVNPARSLGPAIIVGGYAIREVWVFILAPLAGGLVAAAMYRYLYANEGTVSEAEATEAVQEDRAVGPTSATP
jgi:aquaporin Z